MQGRGWSLVLVLISALAIPAAAQELAFSQNARTFETQQGTLLTKSMAFACNGLRIVPDGLPCNPAMTPMRKNPQIELEGLISNGYATLDLMRKLLSGNITQDLVDSLFNSNNQVLQIEANAELDFLSHYFNARYTPASVKFFSVIRNEANPQVDIYAVQEDNITAQSGIEVFDGLFLGLQIRGVERKYINNQFALIDVATDEGKQDLASHTQHAVYFEPSAYYVFDTFWHPSVSAMIANLGSQGGDFIDMTEPIDPQFSVGVSPILPFGELHFEIDYKSLTYQEESFAERLRYGLMYHLGAMYLGAGLDANGISSGLYFTLDSVNAGILYTTTRLPGQSADYYAQTVYIEAGWRL